MRSEFIREFQIDEKSDLEKEKELMQTIKIVEKTLDSMYSNLQFAEGDLIDYFTYKIKAEEAKYDYLIKIAKNKKLENID